MKIEALDLVVSYDAGQRPALDGVSMEALDGCLYAVLGRREGRRRKDFFGRT